MNIHEHQAKEILKEFGAPVSNGVVILSIEDIKKKITQLKSKQFVLKAQISAAIIEAIETEIKLIICITERIPVLDMLKVKKILHLEDV